MKIYKSHYKAIKFNPQRIIREINFEGESRWVIGELNLEGTTLLLQCVYQRDKEIKILQIAEMDKCYILNANGDYKFYSNSDKAFDMYYNCVLETKKLGFNKIF